MSSVTAPTVGVGAVKSADGSPSYCFAPSPTEVFMPCEILRQTSATEVVVREWKSPAELVAAEALLASSSGVGGGGDAIPESAPFTVQANTIVPIPTLEDLTSPPSDLILLNLVHRASILSTLRRRFQRDEIYTSVGPILIALNPFKWIEGIYSDTMVEKYARGEYSLSEYPHVFAMAHDALYGLGMGQNQSLIISGESGAGKTETTKQALFYLAQTSGTQSGVQARILQASPVLEAWGNAKTLRNNNSSRFGKFIEIWFDPVTQKIVGASNTTYLLEKSRVVFQEHNERNYHVFYQLLRGAPRELLQELHLAEIAEHPDMAHYINQSGCVDIAEVDDAKDYRDVEKAYKSLGFTEEERRMLSRIVAGILLLGDVTFDADPKIEEQCIISKNGLVRLEKASELLCVDSATLQVSLLRRSVSAGGGKRGSVSFVYFKNIAEAVDNKNALSKEIYSRCFDWIVAKINTVINAGSDSSGGGGGSSKSNGMIGVLDIFGFEIFRKNSFEQLCINLANEALQQHFNQNIFRAEMELYEREEIAIPNLQYADNKDVIDVIMKKPVTKDDTIGLIYLLDDECARGAGSWEGFLSKAATTHKNSSRFVMRAAKREFAIIHYAGEVVYDPSLFLIKNKDTVSQDLVDLVSISQLPLLQTLFAAQPTAGSSVGGGGQGGGGGGGGGSSNKQTVGRRFAQQLESLISRLNSTKPQYIRCIKPNSTKEANVFVPPLTNEQLTYCGVFEAVVIMQSGYPFRISLLDFLHRYHMLELSVEGRRDVFSKTTLREKCQELVRRAIICESKILEECFVGKTLVFYRAPQHRVLESARKSTWNWAVQVIQRTLRSHFTRKLINGIRVQVRCCVLAVYARNRDDIQAAIRILQSYRGKLSSLLDVVLVFEVMTIGTQFLAVLNKEFEIIESLEVAIGIDVFLPNNSVAMMAVMMTKLSDVQRLMERAKQIKFESILRGKPVKLEWSENPYLAKVQEHLDTFGDIVACQQKFEAGLAQGDEALLEVALEDLSRLRNEGKLSPGTLVTQEKAAIVLISATKELFDRCMLVVSENVAKGALKARYEQEECAFTVDAKPLEAVLHELQEILSEHNEEASRSRLLFNMVERLRNLRAAAKSHEWTNVWDALQDWRAVLGLNSSTLESSSTATSSASTSITSSSEEGATVPKAPPTMQRRSVMTSGGDAKGRFFVPAAISALVASEINNFFICALSFNYGTILVQEMNNNALPSSIAFFSASSSAFSFASLSEAISVAEPYKNFFDKRLISLLLGAKEHLSIRQCVEQLDANKLESALIDAKFISPKSQDFVNGQIFLTFLKTKRELATLIREDGPLGQPGSLHFAFGRIEEFSQLLTVARSLPVLQQQQQQQSDDGAEWTDYLTTCSNLYQLRLHLSLGNQQSALDFVESLSSSSLSATSTAALLVNSNKRDMLESLTLAKQELETCRRELLHVQALKEFLSEIEVSSIHGEVGSIDTRNVDAVNIKAKLAQWQERLLPTLEVTHLFKDVELLLVLRAHVLAGNWRSVEAAIAPVFEESCPPSLGKQVGSGGNSKHNMSTATVKGAHNHPVVFKELLFINDEVLDRNVQAQLKSALGVDKCALLAAAGGEDGNNLVGTEFIVDTSKIKTGKLKMAIEATNQCASKSITTLFLLMNAKTIFHLREAVLAQRWETSSTIFFGGLSTTEMMNQITQPNILEGVNILDTFDTVEKLRVAQLGNTSFVLHDKPCTHETNICVADVLGYALRSGTHSAAADEVALMKRAAIERSARGLLFLAVSHGQVTGSMDSLICQGTETNLLLRAVAFAKMYEAPQTSSLVANWANTAQELLNVRIAVLSSLTSPASGSPPLVLEKYLVAEDIDAIRAGTSPGLPTDELLLVADKLRDSNSLNDLTSRLAHGRPAFHLGKFDSTHVRVDALVATIATAKSLTRRSRHLDRLLQLSDLCVALRVAVKDSNWDNESEAMAYGQGGSNSASAATAATPSTDAAKCVEHYLEAFSHALASSQGDVPPPPACLIEEFRLVGHENVRRKFRIAFAIAFKERGVKGIPFHLDITTVSSQRLGALVAQVHSWKESELDNELVLMVKAGEELIALRDAVSKINSSYTALEAHYPSSSSASSTSNARAGIEKLLSEQSLLPEAISKAIERMDVLSSPIKGGIAAAGGGGGGGGGDYVTLEEEWRPVKELLLVSASASRLELSRAEVELLAEEAITRTFVCRVLAIFRELSSKTKGREQEIFQDEREALDTQLVLDLSEANTRFEQRRSASASSKSWNSPFVVDLYHSSVTLLHLAKTRGLGCFDALDRAWKSSDPNFANTPTLYTLTKTQGELEPYTMQALLRGTNSSRIAFHPVVLHEVEHAEQELEDEITFKELSEKIGKGVAVNEEEAFGHLILDRINTEPLKWALARIDNEGVDSGSHRSLYKIENANVLHLEKTCRVLVALRDAVKVRDFTLAFTTLLAFTVPSLTNKEEEKDLAFAAVLRHIYDADYVPNVHNLGILEFARLALDICDGYWQVLAQIALSVGAATGTRGLLNVPSSSSSTSFSCISWNTIDALLAHLSTMLETSDKCRVLQRLCRRMRQIRSDILSSGDKDQIFRNINVLGVNADLLDKTQGTIADALAMLGSSASFLSESLKAAIQAECELLLQHCAFVRCRSVLRRSLNIQAVFMTVGGLESTVYVEQVIQQAIEAAQSQSWTLALPQETHWSLLLSLAVSLSTILAKCSKGVVVFGTPEMQALAPLLQSFCESVNTFKLRLSQYEGFPHLEELPENILSTAKHFEEAVGEEENYELLREILHDGLFMLPPDFEKTEERLNLLSSPFASDSQSSSIDGISMKSLGGRLLKNLVEKSLELRVAVQEEKWSNVEALVNIMSGLDTFGELGDDLLPLKSFLYVVEARRILAQGMTCCIIPPVLGWTSSSNAALVAFSILDAPLQEALDTLETQSPISCPEVTYLMRLGRLILQLVAAIRAGSWGLDDGDKHKLEQTTSLSLLDSLSSSSPSTSALSALRPSFTRHFASNVKDVLAELKALIVLPGCRSSIDPALHLFLDNAVLQSVSAELAFCNIMARAKRTLLEAQLKGSPGELVVPATALSLLLALQQDLALSPLVDKCHELIRARQTVDVLVSLHQALAVGPFSAEMEARLQLALFMTSNSLELGEISLAGRNFDCSSLLYQEHCDAKTLLAATESSLQNQVQDLSQKIDKTIQEAQALAVKPHELPAKEATTAALTATANAVLGCDIDNARRIFDPSAVDDIFLLHQHLILELEYAAFGRDVDSYLIFLGQVVAGDLIFDHEELADQEGDEDKFTRSLSKIQEKLLENGLVEQPLILSRLPFVLHRQQQQHDVASSAAVSRTKELFQPDTPEKGEGAVASHGQLLYEACMFLSDLRRRQQVRDEEDQQIENLRLALALTWKRCNEESLRTLGSRRFLSQASVTQELTIAQSDLDQRDLMRLCRAAIDSRSGIPKDFALPLDAKRIELASASAAVTAGGVWSSCPPLSKKAKMLYHSCEVALKIRTLATEKKWSELIAFLETRLDDDGIEDTLDPVTLLELHTANRVAHVNLALESALAAYTNGCISGEMGAVDAEAINLDAISAAVEAFVSLDEDESWKTADLMQHECACTALHALRTHALKDEWHIVWDIAKLVLEPKRLDIRPVFTAAIEEITLARDHAAYFVCCESLRVAIKSGGMIGSIGEVELGHVTTSMLEAALHVSKDLIGIQHVDVQQLELTAEVLILLRRAQIRGRWMDVSHHDDALQLHKLSMQRAIQSVFEESLRKLDHNFKTAAAGSSTSITTKLFASSSSSSSSAASEAVASTATVSATLPAWVTEMIQVDNETRFFFVAPGGENEKEKEEVESVESILVRAQQLQQSDTWLADEGMQELVFATDELLHRETVLALLGSLRSPGPGGAAGALNMDRARVDELKAAINFAEQDAGHVSGMGHCRWLLRDAKLLLSLRIARKEHNWAFVRSILADAEAHNKPTNSGPDAGYPLLLPVFIEVQLIKADCLFMHCLVEFAQEMEGSPEQKSGPGIRNSESITSVVNLLCETKQAAAASAKCGVPSPEFDRLIEAMEVALELRLFRNFECEKTPDQIIKRLGVCRERDRRDNVTCYMSLLVPDITQISSVLDKQNHIDTIKREVVKGQSYLLCSIGCIAPGSASTSYLEVALDAASVPLSLMAVKSDLALLDFASTLIKIRSAVARHDWDKVNTLLSSHPALFHSSMVKDEMDRLLIEVKNHEACSVLENALRTGRLMDVIHLAKMIARHSARSKHVEQAHHIQLSTTFDDRGGGAAGSGGAGRRSSKSVAFATAKKLVSTSVNGGGGEEEEDGHFGIIGSTNARLYRRRLSQLPSDFDTGLALLDVAISMATDLKQRSEQTINLLNAAQMIRNLRDVIAHGGSFDEAQAVLTECSLYSMSNTRIPLMALEEIRAAKAGLGYRVNVTQVADALINGGVTGIPGQVVLSKVDFLALHQSLSKAKESSLTDSAADITFDIARHVCALRRAILDNKWFSATPKPVSTVSGNRGGGDIEEKGDDAKQKEDEDADEEMRSQLNVEDLLKQVKGRKFISEIKKLKDVLEIGPEGDVFELELSGSGGGGVSVGSSGGEALVADPSDWMLYQWHAVCKARHELLLMDAELQERRAKALIMDALQIPQVLSSLQKSAFSSSSTSTKHFTASQINSLWIQSKKNEKENDEASKEEKVAAEGEVEATAEDDVFGVESLERALQELEYHAWNSSSSSSETSTSETDAISLADSERSDETRKLLTTARLVLKFRKAMQSCANPEEFKDLLKEAASKIRAGVLSSQSNCGAFELQAYQSVSMTVAITKGELTRCLENGFIAGFLDDLRLKSVEVEKLSHWIYSAKSLLINSRDIASSLIEVLSDAETILALRKALLANELEAARHIVGSASTTESMNSRSVLEVTHVQASLKLSSSKSVLVSLLTEGATLSGGGNLETNFSPFIERLPRLEACLSDLDSVLDHYDSPFLPDPAAEGGKRVVCKNDEEIQALRIAGHASLRLWKAIMEHQWGVSDIASASGVTMSLYPTDPILGRYLACIRQHEVAHRLGDVHSELQVLVKGLKLQHTPELAPSLSLLGAPPPPKSSGWMEQQQQQEAGAAGSGAPPKQVTRNIKRMSVYSTMGQLQPLVMAAEDEGKEEWEKKKAPSDDAPAPGEEVAIIDESGKRKHRRVSVSQQEQVQVQVQDQQQQQQQQEASRALERLQKLSQPQPLIVRTQSRRSSIGALAMSTKQAVAAATTSIEAAAAGEKSSSTDTVAVILSTLDWSSFAPHIKSTFERARDSLIDQSLRLRLALSCADGAVTLDPQGDLVIPPNSTQNLETCLRDAQQIEFYAHVQSASVGGGEMIWGAETSSWIRCVQCLAKCRIAVEAGAIQELIHELQNYDLVTLSRTGGASSAEGLLSGGALGKDKLARAELSLLERFAFESLAEGTLRAAYEYLVSQSKSSFLLHSSIMTADPLVRLAAISTRPQSMHTPTPYYLDLQQLARDTRRLVQAAVLGDTKRFETVKEAIAVKLKPAETIKAFTEAIVYLRKEMLRVGEVSADAEAAGGSSSMSKGTMWATVRKAVSDRVTATVLSKEDAHAISLSLLACLSDLFWQRVGNDVIKDRLLILLHDLPLPFVNTQPLWTFSCDVVLACLQHEQQQGEQHPMLRDFLRSYQAVKFSEAQLANTEPQRLAPPDFLRLVEFAKLFALKARGTECLFELTQVTKLRHGQTAFAARKNDANRDFLRSKDMYTRLLALLNT